MDEPTLELTLATTWPILAALVIGVGVLSWLFLRHIDGRPLLPFEPRRPVPWTFAGPMLVLAPSAAALLFAASSGFTGNGAGAVDAPQASDAIASGALSMLVSAGLLIGWALATCLVLAVTFHATREDFGLPRDGRRLFEDVRLGVIAYLAVWPVVYAIQLFVSLCLENAPTMHSLMKEVLEHPSPAMMAAAVVMACVTAPICEEIAFRLIFQGWLERREQLSREPAIVVTPIDRAPPNDPAANVSPENAAAPTNGVSADEPRAALVDDSTHWGPILTSATFFGVAHYAQGPPAVAAMVCLGISQGYVYQRTHRIVPCIVCHMLFNSVSMLVFFLYQRAAAGH